VSSSSHWSFVLPKPTDGSFGGLNSGTGGTENDGRKKPMSKARALAEQIARWVISVSVSLGLQACNDLTYTQCHITTVPTPTVAYCCK
jgi:hypothetical protein